MLRQTEGFGLANDKGDVRCACSHLMFLSPASLGREQWDTLAGDQDADPFGAVELVGAKGEQVDGLGIQVNREVGGCLDGIAVKGDPFLAGKFPRSD